MDVVRGILFFGGAACVVVAVLGVLSRPLAREFDGMSLSEVVRHSGQGAFFVAVTRSAKRFAVIGSVGIVASLVIAVFDAAR